MMETSGEASDPSGKSTPQPVAQLPELEPRVARRRLSQARHRATMAGLFSNLKKIVYSHSDLTASKWQVLNKAKTHIQNLEQILDTLLKLKDGFNLKDGNASSLEEVREEYARVYSSNYSVEPCRVHEKGSPWCLKDAEEEEEEEEEDQEEEDQEEEKEEEEEEEEEEETKAELVHSSSTLSPELMEFERYLIFYKQMMDLLTGNGIISSHEVMLPIISAAISHLWQNLSEEWKANFLEASAQKHSGLPDLGACPELACAEDSMKDSGVDSQGASCSLVSTPEEVLFEDAFDVASFLDKSEAPSTWSPSSVSATCNPENPEAKFQVYMQILDFLKGLCCVNDQEQEPALAADDELTMLRCTETFDDEDL